MSGARLFRARTRLYLYSCCGERNHLRKFTYSSKLGVYVKARAFCQRGTMNNRPHLLISTHGCTPPAARVTHTATLTYGTWHARVQAAKLVHDATKSRERTRVLLLPVYYNRVLCRAREQLHFKITDTAAQFVTKFAWIRVAQVKSRR